MTEGTKPTRADNYVNKIAELLRLESGREAVEAQVSALEARVIAGNQNGVEDPEARDSLQRFAIYGEQFNKSAQIVLGLTKDAMKKDGDKDLISELPREKLTKNYYSIRPAQIKDDESHNEIAKKHQKALFYEAVVQQGQEADRGTLAEMVRSVVTDEVQAESKGRYSEKADPDNKYVKKETIETLIKLTTPYIVEQRLRDLQKDPAKLLELAGKAAKAAKTDFDKSFKDDTEKAKYAEANLRTLYANAKEDEAKIGWAKLYAQIYTSK